MLGKRQFGLRFLFLAIAVFAIGLWGTRRIYDWYFSVPLADAVESFNARMQAEPVEKLTELEVVNSIRSQLAGFHASADVKSIYAQIASSRRLPRGTSISAVKSYSITPEGPRWFSMVHLNVVTRDNKPCSFVIRREEKQHAAIQPVSTENGEP